MGVGIENPVHLLFIAVVALLVLGPKRLPALARALGQGIREFRAALEHGAHGAPEQEPGAHQPAPEQTAGGAHQPAPEQAAAGAHQPAPEQAAEHAHSPAPEPAVGDAHAHAPEQAVSEPRPPAEAG